jgi:fructose-1,6-bisphosphatase-3
MKAGGKLFIIDGGLSKAYQSTTGIAGYTLIYNSHHLALAEHRPFDPKKESTPKVSVVEKVKSRVMVADTDKGEELKELVAAYREGTIKERVE